MSCCRLKKTLIWALPSLLHHLAKIQLDLNEKGLFVSCCDSDCSLYLIVCQAKRLARDCRSSEATLFFHKDLQARHVIKKLTHFLFVYCQRKSEAISKSEKLDRIHHERSLTYTRNRSISTSRVHLCGGMWRVTSSTPFCSHMPSTTSTFLVDFFVTYL